MIYLLVLALILRAFAVVSWPLLSSAKGPASEETEPNAEREELPEGLYVIPAGWDENGKATFKVLVNPLMVWIWIGGAVLILGTALAFWPDARAESRIPVPRRASAEGMEPSHA